MAVRLSCGEQEEATRTPPRPQHESAFQVMIEDFDASNYCTSYRKVYWVQYGWRLSVSNTEEDAEIVDIEKHDKNSGVEVVAM